MRNRSSEKPWITGLWVREGEAGLWKMERESEREGVKSHSGPEQVKWRQPERLRR